MQGFAFNLRRTKFQDVRVRRAFNLAYDFEWANQNLFYGQYARTSSYFEGQELAAKGLPSQEELALLEPLRDKIPPEVFTQEYKNPVNATPQDFRTHLREAARLLKEAGYSIVDGKLQDSAGQQLRSNFSSTDEAFSARDLALCREPQAAWNRRNGASCRFHGDETARGQFRLRHRRRRFRAVGIAWKRAARILGIGRRGSAGKPQHHGHQEPGRGCACG